MLLFDKCKLKPNGKRNEIATNKTIGINSTVKSVKFRLLTMYFNDYDIKYNDKIPLIYVVFQGLPLQATSVYVL